MSNVGSVEGPSIYIFIYIYICIIYICVCIYNIIYNLNVLYIVKTYFLFATVSLDCVTRKIYKLVTFLGSFISCFLHFLIFFYYYCFKSLFMNEYQPSFIVIYIYQFTCLSITLANIFYHPVSRKISYSNIIIQYYTNK